MIVKCTPNEGNVYIREGPSRLSPSIKIPAYNYAQYGLLYEVDKTETNDSGVWYHIRGLGWSMARFFEEVDINNNGWVVGLNRAECFNAINYLYSLLDTDTVLGDD